MNLAAVLLAIVTVLAGVFVLGDVVSPAGSRVRALAATHVAIALAGVVVLLVAVVDANGGTTWLSFAALLAAGAVGLATLTVNRPPLTEPPDGAAANQTRQAQGHLPLPVVVVHGTAAAVTLILVLAAAVSGARR